jgi:hypothetical protein
MFGNYEEALKFATLNASAKESKNQIDIRGIDDVDFLKKELKQTIETGDPQSEAVINAAYILSLIDNINIPLDSIFKLYQPASAIDYICEEARKYHFLLINEAHYNSQNRVFTSRLLEKLWDAGYRYLALETLGFKDTEINNRKYPVYESGYYSRSSEYGNMMRKALSLGYELIPYEIDMEKFTASNHPNELSFRDSIQAINLIENTYKKDRNGKVLVHAGYDHISEAGSPTYYPLGYYLKSILNQDILTVDQEQMCELNTKEKMHPYYTFAAEHFEINQPTVFLNAKSESLVDDVKRIGIDIQVYHPKTKFTHGIPDWRISKSSEIIPLPPYITDQFSGNLLTAQFSDEDINAVPIDQFVIDESRRLLIPEKNRSYFLSIIGCDGNVQGTLELRVN